MKAQAAYDLRVSFLRSLALDPGLVHQVRDALLQIVDAVAHIVDARYYLVGHRLELVLHVLQQILYLITGGGAGLLGALYGLYLMGGFPDSDRITHVYGQLLHVLGVSVAVQRVVLVQVAVHLVAQIRHNSEASLWCCIKVENPYRCRLRCSVLLFCFSLSLIFSFALGLL